MTFSELQNETGRRGLAVDRSLLFKPPICFWFRSGPAVSGTTLSMAVAMAMTLSIFCTSAPAAEAAGKSADDLTVIPIEELMNIEVSLSRTRQTVSESPSAIHVLTQEDIRRSGATSIPEALRQVPGLDVARITAHSWAVSSRGFNDFFANKLLVLMDGRSVYTPLFSGVFWDVQDTFVEDIERIEVVRGPGASLWGANAVNGVINIVTRTAHDTKGALISGLAGTEEYIGGIRYGGTISEKASYRAYVKYLHRDDQRDAMGADASDEWDMLRTGFRTDWDFSANDSITFQGDYYEGHEDQRLLVVTPPPIPFRMVEGEARLAGGNLLGSWRHTFSEESDLGVQVYYDRTERHDRVHREIRNTYDIDFQHRIALFERQEFIWGLGYRLTTDELGEGRDRTGAIQFIPSHRQDQLFSAFLQDEIAIIEDRLRLTLGSKFEHNDYTGLEIQPNARLLWTPHRNHSVWGAVSRAVRSPARFEHDVRAWFIPPPSMLVGNPEFESESLLAYELGYRIRATRNLSFDLATFYNVYDDLRGIRPFNGFSSTPPFGPLAPGIPPGTPVVPGLTLFRPENRMDGEGYGVEIAAHWEVISKWQLSAGYTWLQMNLHVDSLGVSSDEFAEGDAPQHQFFVQSRLDLPFDFQFDAAVYSVDRLTNPNRSVDDYVRVDLRLGWRPSRELELSIGVQNLFDNQHPEFGSGFLVLPTEIQRSVYGKVTWRF